MLSFPPGLPLMATAATRCSSRRQFCMKRETSVEKATVTATHCDSPNVAMAVPIAAPMKRSVRQPRAMSINRPASRRDSSILGATRSRT